jgi:hypothetical protein
MWLVQDTFNIVPEADYCRTFVTYSSYHAPSDVCLDESHFVADTEYGQTALTEDCARLPNLQATLCLR